MPLSIDIWAIVEQDGQETEVSLRVGHQLGGAVVHDLKPLQWYPRYRIDISKLPPGTKYLVVEPTD